MCVCVCDAQCESRSSKTRKHIYEGKYFECEKQTKQRERKIIINSRNYDDIMRPIYITTSRGHKYIRIYESTHLEKERARKNGGSSRKHTLFV